MRSESKRIAEIIETITDKGTLLDEVQKIIDVVGIRNIEPIDFQILKERAKELRCLTRFNAMCGEARQRSADNTCDLPPFIVFKRSGEESCSPERLAEYIADTEKYYFVSAKDTDENRLFWYEDGVYRLYSPTSAKAVIKSIICQYKSELATIHVIEDTYKQLLYNQDQHVLTDDEAFNGNDNIIVFENGVLRLDTMTIDAHSPDILCNVKIPCKWTGKDAETPVFDRYINHLANDDKEAAQSLLEYIGFVLSNIPVKRFRKSLFLLGDGNTGKTVLITLLHRLIGNDNFQAMPFSKLENRFELVNLYRKRLAADDDCRIINAKENSNFKSMTAGGALSGEQKGKQSFNFVYQGGYIVCSNVLPKFSGDKGSHVYDRILPIQVGRSIPKEKQDKFLLEKLYNERTGIIYKAVRALRSAIDNNYRFSVGAASLKLLERYKIENDSVLMFLSECCEDVTNPKTALSRSAMWTAFQRWCDLTGEYCPKRKEFNERIAQKYNVNEYSLIKASNGKRFYPCTLTQDSKEELHIYDSISCTNNDISPIVQIVQQ